MAQKRKLPPLKEHEGHKFHTDYLCMMLPLLAWPIFLYGMRPLVLWAVAIITAKVCDILICRMRKRRYNRTENSSLVYAVLLVMLMPASVPYYVVVISVAALVFLAKEAFGGYGAYPFHPTAVGYAVAAISWPSYLLKYPVPFQEKLPLWGSLENVAYTESVSHVMRTGGIPNIKRLDLVLGNYASLMGTASVLIILSCGIFLLVRKRISLEISLSFLLSAALIAWCFPRIGDVHGFFWQNADQRMQSLQLELLSGAMIFSAVFLSSEPSTIPKNRLAQVVYGLIWGILTMMYRYYGTYEVGVCFALLVVNAASGYIDRVVVKLTTTYKGVIRRVG